MSENGTSRDAHPLSRAAAPEDWMWTPCKIWPGSTGSTGYGQKRVGQRIMKVHRLAWVEAHGPIPDGLLVCHHCDVRNCFEIEHLFLGTWKDNVVDAVRKGRWRNPIVEAGRAMTHCKRGHPYTEKSRGANGRRSCEVCKRESGRAWDKTHRPRRGGRALLAQDEGEA